MPAKTLLTSFAVVSALTFAAAAQAAPAIAPDAKVVSLAGLDLRSEAGAAAGLRRIEMASAKICGGEPNIQQLERHARYKACVEATVDRAVTSLASPQVTALHTDTGRSLTLVSR